MATIIPYLRWGHPIYVHQHDLTATVTAFGGGVPTPAPPFFDSVL